MHPDTPGKWYAADLGGRWRRPFGLSEIAGLYAALRRLGGDPGFDLTRIDPDDLTFDAGPAALAAEIADALNGSGFCVIEGFPVERYSERALRAIFWMLSLNIGTPVAQSSRGDVLGDVRDIGTGIDGRQGRGYTSNAELNFHCDAADVSGLFFLKVARAGGVSRVASALAVHDEIVRRRPDLLEVLYQPFAWSWQGNQAPGARAYYEMPVFGRAGSDGAVACSYVRTNILRAEANAGAPPMSDAQVEAVELFATVAREPGMYVEAQFAPGTLLFVNNHTVLHMRTAFEDWPEPERRRHLLRVWLCPPDARRLPDAFGGFYRHVAAGTLRGGYPSGARQRRFSTQ